MADFYAHGRISPYRIARQAVWSAHLHNVGRPWPVAMEESAPAPSRVRTTYYRCGSSSHQNAMSVEEIRREIEGTDGAFTASRPRDRNTELVVIYRGDRIYRGIGTDIKRLWLNAVRALREHTAKQEADA